MSPWNSRGEMASYNKRDELWKQTNEIKITEQITRLKWNLIGHNLRKENAIEKEALEWNPHGQRKRGRPNRSWQKTI
jgi:hypothetical protein